MKGIYEAADNFILELTNAGFNSVTFGSISDVDIEKQNLYPFANIELENAALTGKVSNITFNVIAADIVDDKSTKTGLKQRTDNLLDIYHDIATLVNTAWQRYLRNPSVNYIVSPELNMDAFNMRFENRLAGYEFNFTIQIPNTQESAC